MSHPEMREEIELRDEDCPLLSVGNGPRNMGQGATDMSRLWTIELFGGISARSPQERITRFATQKTALLLAYLAFYRHQSHLRETLVEMLWPEAEPAQGRSRLSTLLSYLRTLLEPPGVVA